jgi:hypothetical protein
MARLFLPLAVLLLTQPVEAELTRLLPATSHPNHRVRLLLNLVRNLPQEGRAAPYLVYSLGLSRGGALGAGVGARIFLSRRVFVAPQGRLIADGNTGGLEFTGGIGFVLRP